jgi:hypothetical protein
MKIRTMMVAALSLGVFVAPLRAQEPEAKKPGGLNKVAHNVSKTLKKAGRDTKAEVKRDASKAHNALTDAGNKTKEVGGEVTGIHKIGGDVGKAAKSVSHASKKTAAKAKHGVKHAKADIHKDLTKSGKTAKEEVKKP